MQGHPARVGGRDGILVWTFGYMVWFGSWFIDCRAILLELEAGTSSIKMMAAKHPVSQDLMHGHSTPILHFFNNISSHITKQEILFYVWIHISLSFDSRICSKNYEYER